MIRALSISKDILKEVKLAEYLKLTDVYWTWT